MRVTINGEARELPRPMSLVDVLAHLELVGLVAIELNGEIIPRAQHASRAVAEGDVLEIVHMVGGG